MAKHPNGQIRFGIDEFLILQKLLSFFSVIIGKMILFESTRYVSLCRIGENEVEAGPTI